jgi:hypothetical membrane protein
MVFDLKKEPKWFSTVAGALFFLAGVIAFMGIITGEALYPDYNTADNQISDLGGSEPPNSIILQPSAAIFNTTMMIVGLSFIVGAYCLHRASVRRSVTLPVLLLGVGALGVGIFPGNTGGIHALFAMLTFVSGGVAAILSYRVLSAPMKYISVVLGAIGLSALLLYVFMGDSSPFAPLGIGGVERWVAYPIILWAMGFGGYLMGRNATTSSE